MIKLDAARTMLDLGQVELLSVLQAFFWQQEVQTSSEMAKPLNLQPYWQSVIQPRVKPVGVHPHCRDTVVWYKRYFTFINTDMMLDVMI